MLAKPNNAKKSASTIGKSLFSTATPQRTRVSHTFVIVYSIEFGIVLPVAREKKVNSKTCKYQPANRVMIVSLSSL